MGLLDRQGEVDAVRQPGVQRFDRDLLGVRIGVVAGLMGPGGAFGRHAIAPIWSVAKTDRASAGSCRPIAATSTSPCRPADMGCPGWRTLRQSGRLTTAAPSHPPSSAARPAPAGSADARRADWPAQACMRCTSPAVLRRSTHGGGQCTLNRIGRRSRGIGRGRSPYVAVREAPARPAAESAGHGGILGSGERKGVGPGRVNASFRTAKETGADLHCARAQDQGCRDAACVSDAACSNDRDRDGIRYRGQKREQSDLLTLGVTGIETTAMPACLRTLSDDRISPRAFCRPCLGNRRHGRKPRDAVLLQLGDERCRIEPHDRRDDGWSRLQDRPALRIKGGWHDIRSFRWDLRAPSSQEVAHLCLVGWIAGRRGIGDPRVDLERTVRAGADRAAQARISSGPIRRAPQAPRPPAFATATESAGGQAPAIGANRIGTCSPNREQKISVRWRAALMA